MSKKNTMKTLSLCLALTLVGIVGTVNSAIAASFTGTLSDVTLKVDISQLSDFNLENVDGANSPKPDIRTTGTGRAAGNSTKSTLWDLDPLFSFIQLDYDGGDISGQSGNNGSGSAISSGNSNKLAITNTGSGGQLLTIGGTYSVSLTTIIQDPELESAWAEFTLDIVTESGTILKSFTNSINGENQFNETKDFTVSLNVEGSKTVFIKSKLSGSAEMDDIFEIPEPSPLFAFLLVLGLGALTKKRKKG